MKRVLIHGNLLILFLSLPVIAGAGENLKDAYERHNEEKQNKERQLLSLRRAMYNAVEYYKTRLYNGIVIGPFLRVDKDNSVYEAEDRDPPTWTLLGKIDETRIFNNGNKRNPRGRKTMWVHESSNQLLCEYYQDLHYARETRDAGTHTDFNYVDWSKPLGIGEVQRSCYKRADKQVKTILNKMQ